MGQKVNPTSLRLQINKNWKSRWFADKKDAYRKYLQEDLKIRDLIVNKLGERIGIENVEIERSANMVTIIIYTSRPGIIIGRGGSGIDLLKKSIEQIVKSPIKLSIEEVKRPELRAKIVADNVAGQLERRISYRRAVRGALDAAMQSGAKGIKIQVAGRLGGIEMARTNKEIRGSIPLHTLRADIDYAKATAKTSAGLIGVKVWINKTEDK